MPGIGVKLLRELGGKLGPAAFGHRQQGGARGFEK